MFNKKITIALFAGALFVSASPIAFSHEGDNPRLQYRHDVMELAKYSLKGMTAILQGNIKDGNQFPALAQVMANAAAISNEMFKEDTRGLEGKTAAKPKIWDNWEDFSKRMSAFNDAAQELAAVSGEGDMKKNIVAFKNTVKNCKSCHDEYRSEH